MSNKDQDQEVRYQLMYNGAAGDHYVNELTAWQVENPRESMFKRQEGHFNEWGIYASKEELNAAINVLRGPTVYAVYTNDMERECYYSEEHGLSGNWRSDQGRFRCVAEYSTLEEAENHVQQYRNDLGRQVETRELDPSAIEAGVTQSIAAAQSNQVKSI